MDLPARNGQITNMSLHFQIKKVLNLFQHLRKCALKQVQYATAKVLNLTTKRH